MAVLPSVMTRWALGKIESPKVFPRCGFTGQRWRLATQRNNGVENKTNTDFDLIP
jgi:hypothetical protein